MYICTYIQLFLHSQLSLPGPAPPHPAHRGLHHGPPLSPQCANESWDVNQCILTLGLHLVHQVVQGNEGTGATHTRTGRGDREREGEEEEEEEEEGIVAAMFVCTQLTHTHTHTHTHLQWVMVGASRSPDPVKALTWCSMVSTPVGLSGTPKSGQPR